MPQFKELELLRQQVAEMEADCRDGNIDPEKVLRLIDEAIQRAKGL